MTARHTIGGSLLTKADIRPVRANCWRCHGLEKVWSDSNYDANVGSLPCPTCAGTGVEMIPMTELFVHNTALSRKRGFQNVKLWGVGK